MDERGVVDSAAATSMAWSLVPRLHLSRDSGTLSLILAKPRPSREIMRRGIVMGGTYLLLRVDDLSISSVSISALDPVSARVYSLKLVGETDVAKLLPNGSSSSSSDIRSACARHLWLE